MDGSMDEYGEVVRSVNATIRVATSWRLYPAPGRRSRRRFRYRAFCSVLATLFSLGSRDDYLRRVARHSITAVAILLPLAIFLLVLSLKAMPPNTLIYLAYVGSVSMAVGLLIWGVGMIRSCRTQGDARGTAVSGRVGR